MNLLCMAFILGNLMHLLLQISTNQITKLKPKKRISNWKNLKCHMKTHPDELDGVRVDASERLPRELLISEPCELVLCR